MSGFETDYFLNGFLPAHDDTLQRLAHYSRGRLTKEDLINDAFIFAIELGDERGCPLDLKTVQDQQLLLAHLKRHINQDGRRRHVSLDQAWENGEGETLPTLGERQAGRADWEPLQLLLLDEEPDGEPEVDVLALARATYSQAAAYLILLERFEQSWTALAEFLRLSVSVLKARFASACEWLRKQRSLFDGVERVSSDFLPYAGRTRRKRKAPMVQGEQALMAWPEGESAVPVGD